MSDNETLADVVKSARKRVGISQRELSRRTDIDNNTIALIEKGQRKKPNVLSLKKLGNALDLDLRDLMILSGYSLEDINATIDLKEEDFVNHQRILHFIFSNYLKESDITKTEWFCSFDKKTQKGIKNALKEYINRY